MYPPYFLTSAWKLQSTYQRKGLQAVDQSFLQKFFVRWSRLTQIELFGRFWTVQAPLSGDCLSSEIAMTTNCCTRPGRHQLITHCTAPVFTYLIDDDHASESCPPTPALPSQSR